MHDLLRALAKDFLRAGLLDRAEAALAQLEGTPYQMQAWLQLLALHERAREWDKADAVAQALDHAHRFVASNYSYNNEMALQSAICLAYFHAIDRFTVLKEPELGNGRADVVLLPSPVEGKGLPALIIELKKDEFEKTPKRSIKRFLYKKAYKLRSLEA